MRRRNFNELGHAHELTFGCYRGFPFLEKDRVRAWLTEAINDARGRWTFQVWASVFMPEHVHLIVRPQATVYDLARIRAAIKEPVSKRAIRHLEEHAPDWLPRIMRRRGKNWNAASGKAAGATIATSPKAERSWR